MSAFPKTDPSVTISSRHNPNFKALRRLTQDNAAWRTQGRIWLEGEHLCQAWLQANNASAAVAPTLPSLPLRALAWVLSASYWATGTVHSKAHIALPCWVLDDALFAALSPLPSASGVGLVLAVSPPAGPARLALLRSGVPTVILDGLQDPGNAGSILRSSQAMGFIQIIATRGSVALWCPKVLRAAMGAHFGLHIVEGLALTEDADLPFSQWLSALQLPLLLALPHSGPALHECDLPFPCAWVFGHEGQGVSAAWQDRSLGLPTARLQPVRIAQPGGAESLNVAAAAAICLHASATLQARLSD